jgi:hypothetical protein
MSDCPLLSRLSCDLLATFALRKATQIDRQVHRGEVSDSTVVTDTPRSLTNTVGLSYLIATESRTTQVSDLLEWIGNHRVLFWVPRAIYGFCSSSKPM